MSSFPQKNKAFPFPYVQEQDTVNTKNEAMKFELKGRHDPYVAIRDSIVCEAMMALVLANMALLNLGKKMEHLTSTYK